MSLPSIADVVGIIGVLIVLIAYYQLQVGKLKASSLQFSILNAFGSSLILVSLYFNFNLASFLIEIAWVAISLYGIYGAVCKKKSHNG